MTIEELEHYSRQELIEIILKLASILKEEDAVIEQHGLLFQSEKTENLKQELKGGK